jgi:hypothetical protein
MLFKALVEKEAAGGFSSGNLLDRCCDRTLKQMAKVNKANIFRLIEQNISIIILVLILAVRRLSTP